MALTATRMTPPDDAERLRTEMLVFGKREVASRSDIGKFYVREYKRPRLLEVTGCEDHLDFYVQHFAGRLREGGGALVSIGSGDASVELQVARRLRKLGFANFTLECIELSDERNGRAKERAEKAGLGDCLKFTAADFNEWQPQQAYVGVMAQYALHHVTNLEGLFGGIREAIAPRGVFCTVDTVGRNGHQRWPETLAVVEKLWATLPMEKRRHRYEGKVYEQFPNLDQSTRSFEGIRAQDILPLLVKNFGFEAFVAFGGLTDVFTNATWGHYDPEEARDVAFIDLVHMLNDLLIDLGHIKPTQIFAAMSVDKAAKPRIWRRWTPEFCVRPVSGFRPAKPNAPPDPERILIEGHPISPRQYRSLFPDLAENLPDADAPPKAHYFSHGWQELAEGRRKVRADVLQEILLQQLSPEAPTAPRAASWRYFDGASGTLDLIFSDSTADGGFSPDLPARRRDGDARLYLRDAGLHFQRGIPGVADGIQETARWIEAVVARVGATTIRTIGRGAGGHAAVLFGHLLDADAIHAIAPELILDSEVDSGSAYADLRRFLPALAPRLALICPAYDPEGYRTLQAGRTAGVSRLAMTADFHPAALGVLIERLFGAAEFGGTARGADRAALRARVRRRHGGAARRGARGDGGAGLRPLGGAHRGGAGARPRQCRPALPSRGACLHRRRFRPRHGDAASGAAGDRGPGARRCRPRWTGRAAGEGDRGPVLRRAAAHDAGARRAVHARGGGAGIAIRHTAR